MLVKIEARILIFPGTDFHFPSTSVPPGTFLGSEETRSPIKSPCVCVCVLDVHQSQTLPYKLSLSLLLARQSARSYLPRRTASRDSRPLDGMEWMLCYSCARSNLSQKCFVYLKYRTYSVLCSHPPLTATFVCKFNNFSVDTAFCRTTVWYRPSTW